MGKLIVVGCLFGFVLCAIFSLMAFMGKEVILSNLYLRASEEDRKKMDRKAFCLQTAIIFLLLGLISLLNALRMLLRTAWLGYAATAVTVIGIIYVLVSENILKKKYGK